MNINNKIIIFADFLNASWNIVNPLLINRQYAGTDFDSISDWLQANWELLIEKHLFDIGDSYYLEAYGDGADYNGRDSCRILDGNSSPSHIVVVKHKNEIKDILNNRYSNSILVFHSLVGFKNGYYVYEPPFDHVLCNTKDGEEFVYKIKDVNFILTKIDDIIFE